MVKMIFFRIVIIAFITFYFTILCINNVVHPIYLIDLTSLNYLTIIKFSFILSYFILIFTQVVIICLVFKFLKITNIIFIQLLTNLSITLKTVINYYYLNWLY